MERRYSAELQKKQEKRGAKRKMAAKKAGNEE